MPPKRNSTSRRPTAALTDQIREEIQRVLREELETARRASRRRVPARGLTSSPSSDDEDVDSVPGHADRGGCRGERPSAPLSTVGSLGDPVPSAAGGSRTRGGAGGSALTHDADARLGGDLDDPDLAGTAGAHANHGTAYDTHTTDHMFAMPVSTVARNPELWIQWVGSSGLAMTRIDLLVQEMRRAFAVARLREGGAPAAASEAALTAIQDELTRFANPRVPPPDTTPTSLITNARTLYHGWLIATRGPPTANAWLQNVSTRPSDYATFTACFDALPAHLKTQQQNQHNGNNNRRDGGRGGRRWYQRSRDARRRWNDGNGHKGGNGGGNNGSRGNGGSGNGSGGSGGGGGAKDGNKTG